MRDPKALDQAPFDLAQCQFPLRLAVNTTEGFPHIVSLWFEYRAGLLRAVTHKSSWILKQLAHSPKVGFEISCNKPPYKGVRGSAVVSLTPLQDELLERLIARYLGGSDSSLATWLLSRKSEEVVLSIVTQTVTSWDYSSRMSDVNVKELNHA